MTQKLEIVAFVRERVATVLHGEATLYRRAGDAAVAVDEREGTQASTPVRDATVLAGFALAAIAVRGARVLVPIPGTDGTVRWLLVVRFPEAHAITEGALFALELLGRSVADAATNGALVREVEESRAAVLRLAALKADLVTILAHDFKGPLTTVMGYAELLADGGLDDATQRSAVGAIESASRKLASLANDTLALSRLDPSELVLDRDLLDLASVVEDAARSFASERPVRVRRLAPSALVHGDMQRLRQVFENLIGNAIRFSPAGGEIDVSIAVADGRVVVRVRDGGIGIPAEELPSLFARFARASNARALGIAGAGLGLFLARSLVESHGGTVSLADAPPQGTVAAVTFPVAEGVPTPLPRTLVLAKPTDATAFIAYALRTNGYAVRVAGDLAEAELRMKRDTYDLALVDARVADLSAAAALLVKSDGSPMPRLLIAPADDAVPDGWTDVVRTPYLIRDALAVVARCFPLA